MNRLLVPFLAATLGFSACATTDSSSTAAPREEKIYRTGSNIPVRDPDALTNVKRADPSTVEPARSPNKGGG
jgi:hypothetical protein